MPPEEPIHNMRATHLPPGSADDKAVQVLGFHVKGEEEEDICESGNSSLLGQSYRGNGSPMPVIVPINVKSQKCSSKLLPPSREEQVEGSRKGSLTVSTNVASELTRQITPRKEGEVTGSGAFGPVRTGHKAGDMEDSAGVLAHDASSESAQPETVKKPKAKSQVKQIAKEKNVGSKEKQKQEGKKPQVEGKGVKEKNEKKLASNELHGSSSKSLFDHLKHPKQIPVNDLLRQPDIWNFGPEIVKLGVQGVEMGGITRCRAMLDAFAVLASSYTQPSGLFDPMDFLVVLNQHIGFLVECCPLNAPMKNAIRHAKVEISKLPANVPLTEGCKNVVEVFEQYKTERINVEHIIAREAASKIRTGDIVLTFSPSSSVMEVILHAWCQEEKAFKVVVIDSRPNLAGRKIVSKLVAKGIPCSYACMNAVSFIMREVSTVFMGASAVLMNGAVVGRIGTGAVGLVAHSHNVPVVICSETCKFYEQAQLNSFTQNELGDPHDLENTGTRKCTSVLAGWEKNSKLDILNLKYDIMPAEFVSMIVTEVGMIPTTSVPVILRDTVLNDKH